MKAPIALFTYNRLNHTKNTIKKLQDNEGALDSDIFIFSDGWKTDSDKELVLSVRRYINSVKGFKSLRIIESTVNKGLAKSIIEGVSMVFNNYTNIIVLEDDLKTSPNFINFMNEALEFYNPNEIWSIAGYSPKINISKDYKYNTYLANRNCSWGWATWKTNWERCDWNLLDISEFTLSRKKQNHFNNSGNDLSIMLLKQYHGIIDSWSIRFNYSGFKFSLPTVYPINSLVENSGTDGSGTNVNKTNKYNVKLNAESLKDSNFCPNNTLDNEILQKFKKFYDTSALRCIINLMKISKYRSVILHKKR